MSLDFLYQRFGDVEFPSDSSDVENSQLFSVYDPGRDALLGLFKAAINQELGHGTAAVDAASPWGVARVGTKLASALPVADTLYTQPTGDILKETKLSFPLLCLYRTTAQHEEFSLAREAIRCTWGLDYILPPLGSDDLRRLGGILVAVRHLVPLVIRKQGHPAYESGAIQFGQGDGRFSWIKVTSSTEGPAEFSSRGEGAVHYAVHFDLETLELDDSLDGVFGDFESVSLAVGVGGGEGLLPNAVEASTDGNPDPNHGDPVG